MNLYSFLQLSLRCRQHLLLPHLVIQRQVWLVLNLTWDCRHVKWCMTLPLSFGRATWVGDKNTHSPLPSALCQFNLEWLVSFSPSSPDFGKIKWGSLLQVRSQNRVSLVAQWLRIHLPMQGTQVRALVQEDPTCCGATKPLHHDYWACALEPTSHNFWAYMPQLLKPTSSRADRKSVV